jgi:hypothetical protein
VSIMKYQSKVRMIILLIASIVAVLLNAHKCGFEFKGVKEHKIAK